MGSLGLANSRETNELEYGADDAYLLCQPDVGEEDEVELKHVKSRFGAMEDLRLRFDRPFQHFEGVVDFGDDADAASDNAEEVEEEDEDLVGV